MGFCERPSLPLKDVDEHRDCGRGVSAAWMGRDGADDRFGGSNKRFDCRKSTQTGRKPSRYRDAVVPLADRSGSSAAKDKLPSPSISAASVISGQMVRHVHV